MAKTIEEDTALYAVKEIERIFDGDVGVAVVIIRNKTDGSHVLCSSNLKKDVLRQAFLDIAGEEPEPVTKN